MKYLGNWSIRYKLLALLLLLVVTAFGATGAIAYFMSVHAMEQGVTNQLEGVRRSKASRIEDYYRTIHSHVLTLSEDRMIIDAMREFPCPGWGAKHLEKLSRLTARYRMPNPIRMKMRTGYMPRIILKLNTWLYGRNGFSALTCPLWILLVVCP